MRRGTNPARALPRVCRIAAGAALLFLLHGSAAVCRAQQAKAQLLSSIARLEKSLPPGADEAKRRAEELRGAREALEAGRFYLGLQRLQGPWVMSLTEEYVGAKAGVAKAGLEAFEQEWERLGRELDEREKLLASGFAPRTPAAVRALAESSASQVRPYYRSGRLYGMNTTLADGLFYMGLAPAHLDFALFCRGLTFDDAKPRPELGPLDAELRALDTAALAAYRRAEADAAQANAKQPQFNRLNSTLKLATELSREGRRFGALNKYLDAALQLELINAPPVAAVEAGRLKALAKSLAARGASAKEDHSVGLLYLESAQNELAKGDVGEEGLRRAAAILERVLPSYFKIIGGGSR